MKSGIYKITNIINGKFYIGSAVNIKARWGSHKSELRDNVHHNRHLQRSYNKRGLRVFKFEVLFTCPKEDLIRIEQYCIDNHKPKYNISPTAGNCLGVKHTVESKKNMSLAHIGFKVKEETKEKIKNSLKGRVNNWQSKTVVQVNVYTLEPIVEFNSTVLAEQYTGISRYSIANAARGQRSTAGGFIWKYV